MILEHGVGIWHRAFPALSSMWIVRLGWVILCKVDLQELVVRARGEKGVFEE